MIVFYNEYARGWLFFMAFLFGASALLTSQNLKRNLIAGAFFLICALFYELDLKYLYPSLVSFAFLLAFGLSLRGEALITAMARLKTPLLSDEVIAYTRALTKIWCVFFALNGALAFWLSRLEDKGLWAIYTGVLSYILMGALFAGELFYRYKILKVKS